MTDFTPRPSVPLARLIAEAFDNLWAVRKRSFLALLGIVIGTASVVALINLGYNAGQEAINQFKEMGTDLLVAQPPIDLQGKKKQSAYDIQDIRNLRHSIPSIESIAPLITASGQSKAHGKSAYVTVIGTTQSLAAIARFRLRSGRFLSDNDGAEPFAVVGATAAQRLASPGPTLQAGDMLRIENTVLTVIGVLDDLALNPLMPVDFGDVVFIPMEGARRFVSPPSITSFVARVAPEADPVIVAQEVSHALESKMRGQSVPVRSARQLINGMKHQADLFTWLFAGIGGISLLVGGIGVMNVMLMGVMERRKEIGIRMAVGARPRDISIMFLVEAIVLSAVGGLTGAIVGMATAWGFAHLSGWSFAFSPLALPLGTGVACLTGIFSGYHPATLAARLNPIEALHSE